MMPTDAVEQSIEHTARVRPTLLLQAKDRADNLSNLIVGVARGIAGGLLVMALALPLVALLLGAALWVLRWLRRF